MLLASERRYAFAALAVSSAGRRVRREDADGKEESDHDDGGCLHKRALREWRLASLRMSHTHR
jgi:hypothetical protein